MRVHAVDGAYELVRQAEELGTDQASPGHRPSFSTRSQGVGLRSDGPPSQRRC